MNNKPEIKPMGITPLKYICMTIGELPSSYLESMSYYEQLIWLTKFLQERMIPALDNNALAVEELQKLFTELQNYVNNYFDNLDVQDEINNKLDQMLEDGVLEQIIEQYLQSTAIWCFDTVENMKQATNLINGSYAKTVGYHSPNDGGTALYKITDTESLTDYQEELDSGLYATLITNDYVTPEQFGAYGDETHDDTVAIQKCIDYATSKKYEIKLSKKYLVTPSIHPEEYPTYNASLMLRSNLTIRGNGYETGIIIDDTGYTKYWSLFFPEETNRLENIILENFSFYQKQESLSTMGYGSLNPRCILTFVGSLYNCVINNILFDDVYGVNVISIDCPNSKNITISNCLFNFKNILSYVNNYDCSVLYLRCKDYICVNNQLNGDNFKCVGGIELHGYNGICKNNIIKEFRDCINVAPNYDKPANILIDSNTLYGYVGVTLWDNVTSGSLTGIKDVRILNNKMEIDTGSESRTTIAGVKTTDASFTHSIENLIVKNNVIDFINYNSENSINLGFSGGVNLNRSINMTNLNISDNIITNSPACGVSIGSTSSNSTGELKNILINNNIIKNSGIKATGNDGYKCSIAIFYKFSGNISIKNNILINEIEDGGSLYAILNSSTVLENYKNYVFDNIVKTITTGRMLVSASTFYVRRDNQYPIDSPNGTKFNIKVANDGTISAS